MIFITIPVHTGVEPLQTPFTLLPSPLHICSLFPSNRNPSLHEYVAVVLKVKMVVVSGLYTMSPLVIELRGEQVIAANKRICNT